MVYDEWDMGEPTSVHVSLFGQLIIRVTVRVDRAIQLLECHERHDQLVVGMQQAAKPLLRFDVMDLRQDITSAPFNSSD